MATALMSAYPDWSEDPDVEESIVRATGTSFDEDEHSRSDLHCADTLFHSWLRYRESKNPASLPVTLTYLSSQTVYTMICFVQVMLLFPNVQRKAQEEREAAMRIPGMLKPSQIEDKDEDI